MKMRKMALTRPMVLRDSEVWYTSLATMTFVVASTDAVDDPSYFLSSSAGVPRFSSKFDAIPNVTEETQNRT